VLEPSTSIACSIRCGKEEEPRSATRAAGSSRRLTATRWLGLTFHSKKKGPTMSRSFRIAVKESVDKVIKAEDKVCTDLEILEVLPPEDMATLLAKELESRGFEQQKDGNLVRKEKGVVITVDPKKGTVTVSAESSESVSLETSKEGRAWDDVGPSAKKVREDLQGEAKKDLDKKVQQKTAELQSKVTDKLEAQLGDLRAELDQAVNKITAEALKVKAAQLGQIKEMSEDPQTGSLTIVVEV